MKKCSKCKQEKELKRLGPKKDRPIITCCASGNRSRVAKSIIKSAGYTEVHNGGGWMKVQRLIPLQQIHLLGLRPILQKTFHYHYHLNSIVYRKKVWRCLV